MHKKWLKSSALCLTLTMLPMVAQAFEDQLSIRVITVPGAPIVLQRCRAERQFGSSNGLGETFYMNTVNRSSHDALGYTVEYKVYDREETLIGQQGVHITFGTPINSSDTQVIKGEMVAFNLSEESTAVATITCKVTAASFTGRREWHAGQRWPEALKPVPPPSREASQASDSQNASMNGRPAGSATTPPFKLRTLINSLIDGH